MGAQEFERIQSLLIKKLENSPVVSKLLLMSNSVRERDEERERGIIKLPCTVILPVNMQL